VRVANPCPGERVASPGGTQMAEQQEFVEALTTRFREELDRELAALEDAAVTMDRLEELVERVKLRIGQELQQRILERQPDELANRAVCPACGGQGRFHSSVRRLLLTRHGEVEFRRRWYECGCGQGFSPLEGRLGLDAGATTPWVRALVAEWAATRSFADVVQDLRRSRGLPLGESTVQRLAVACGAQLREASEAEGRAYEVGVLPTVLHHPRVIYLSMDGVYAPLRDPWKKDHSAGPLVCRSGECKVGMAYEVLLDRQGRPRVAWREYTATFQDIEAFRPQMAALAHRCGASTATVQVFLADTLACNWSLAADYFPEAVQIVDWRHAVSHLETVASDFFGEGTAPGKQWLAARKEELWAGKADAVATAIRDLPVLPRETQTQTETRRREAAYFTQHQERMRYATFREKGYQIGSGVMEASCRTVVNQRLDRSGMHWRQEIADEMVALRASCLSTTKPDLRFKHRPSRRQPLPEM